MKLIYTATGETVRTGEANPAKVVTGVLKNKLIVLTELCEPSRDHPKGVVRFQREGIYFKQFLPFVIGAEWVKDNGKPLV